jgi:phospholipid-binding lipoprotein MlaA
METAMATADRFTVRLAVVALAAFGLAACASTGQRTPGDPLEPANRDVFRFNEDVDRAALKPVAVAYHEHTPSWFQTGVSNFFANLTVPGTALNDLLQGKVLAAGQDVLRFAINTTLGWGGLIDVATGGGVPRHDEDLGQTLGKWGVPPGPYLMVPLLGPSTLRDLPSRVVDTVYEPLYWIGVSSSARWGSLALSAVDTRAQLLPLDETLDKVFDKYAFVRNSYLQRREYLIYDGNPPEKPLDEELPEDDAEAAPDEAPPGP